jgi:hypothetical protein
MDEFPVNPTRLDAYKNFKIYRCWVSEYQTLPELDSDSTGNSITIEHIKRQNEGWERNTSVVEPKEPS